MKVNNPLKLQSREFLKQRFNNTYYYRTSYKKLIEEHNEKYNDNIRLSYNFFTNKYEVIYE